MLRRLIIACALAVSSISMLAAAAPAHASLEYGDCGFAFKCSIVWYNGATSQAMGWVSINCDDVIKSSGDTNPKDGYWEPTYTIRCP